MLSRPSLTTSYDYEVIASTLVTMDDIGAERELHRIGLPRTPVILAHGPRSGCSNEHHDRRHAEDLTPRCSGARPAGSTALRRTSRRAMESPGLAPRTSSTTFVSRVRAAGRSTRRRRVASGLQSRWPRRLDPVSGTAGPRPSIPSASAKAAVPAKFPSTSVAAAASAGRSRSPPSSMSSSRSATWSPDSSSAAD